MPSHGKQSILYTHTSGPNGWKAQISLFVQLGLTCHSIYLGFKKQEQKAPEHRKLNPNGRISMLIDHHNGDFVIWESNAILSHLVDKYDKDHKLTVADEKDQHRVTQWLFFPGPDKGACILRLFWFTHSHPERIPSAIERYQKDMLCVIGVLANEPSGWLVGSSRSRTYRSSHGTGFPSRGS
ncbi:hypothetical protein C8Q80DRAFT_1109499 [Daedaleopsis nitida]|nr:hypothetical protein C8Q80DRAFT_1109499 [Daedaleopsis nitida]